MEASAAVGGQDVVGPLFQVCADRFGAVTADRDGHWSCVEQSQSPAWFVVESNLMGF